MNPLELLRDNPYFDQLIPVTISNSPEDSRVSNLTFRIIPGNRQVKLAGQNERVIHFEVS